MRLTLITLFVMLLGLSLAHAQETGSSICVLAFEDANENGVRDAGEVPLSGISAHLAIETDIIFQTYISDAENRPHCFEGLPNGVYNLYFADSVSHRATTQNSAAISLEGTQRVRVEFGAVSLSPFAESSTTDPTDKQLATTERLLIAALGSVVLMIFMFGFGVAIAGFIY